MNIRSYFDETIVAVAFSKLLEKVIDILLNWNLEETIQQFEQISATYSKTNYLSSMSSFQSVLRRLLTLVNPTSYVNNIECILHLACWQRDNEIIDQLLDDNPNTDVDCISKFGVTPLLICIFVTKTYEV